MKKPKRPSIGDYPAHLRGFATNRYGGNKLQRERGLRGGTYGPASDVRSYSKDECAEYERKLRDAGGLE